MAVGIVSETKNAGLDRNNDSILKLCMPREKLLGVWVQNCDEGLGIKEAGLAQKFRLVAARKVGAHFAEPS
jgi:hypothetical protein